MAFVTRSKRNDNYGQSTSGPDVGPGTYSYDGTTNGPGPKMGVKYSIPPFGSSCEREISTSNAKEFLTPGPGYYSGDAVAPPAAAQTNMSSQFASKSTRLLQDQMLQKKAFTPGPGSYSFTEKWADPKPPQPTRAQSTVSWAKVATAPSIPAPSQSFGYEEGSRGELIQGKPPPSVGYAGKAEDGAGPGAYTPDDRLMRAKAPSLDFGKSKTTRTGLLIPKEVAARPGPGAYDMGPADSAPKSTVGSSVFASATTRQFIAKNTGLLPGPGAYNTTSSFRTRAQAAAAAPQVAATAALPVHTQRVKGTPGPGHYQLSSDFDPKQERARGDKSSAGFLSTALRFCGQVGDSQRTPGPGYYSDGTCTNQNMSSKLAKRLTGRYGVFGTTSQRFGGGRAAGDPGEVPADTAVGPCSYDPPRDVNPSIVRRRDVRQAVFVSNVKRLNDKQDEATPGVGAYEVGGNLSTEKRSHQARSSHFLSNDVRFKPTKPSTVPGPGEYVQGHNTLSSKVVGIDVTDRDGSMRRVALGCTQDRSGQSRPTGTKSLRFPESKTAHTPGPGYYDSVLHLAPSPSTPTCTHTHRERPASSRGRSTSPSVTVGIRGSGRQGGGRWSGANGGARHMPRPHAHTSVRACVLWRECAPPPLPFLLSRSRPLLRHVNLPDPPPSDPQLSPLPLLHTTQHNKSNHFPAFSPPPSPTLFP